MIKKIKYVIILFYCLQIFSYEVNATALMIVISKALGILPNSTLPSSTSTLTFHNTKALSFSNNLQAVLISLGYGGQDDRINFLFDSDIISKNSAGTIIQDLYVGTIVDNAGSTVTITCKLMDKAGTTVYTEGVKTYSKVKDNKDYYDVNQASYYFCDTKDNTASVENLLLADNAKVWFKGAVINFVLDGSGVDYSVSTKIDKSDGITLVSIPSKKLMSSKDSVAIPSTTKLTGISVDYQTSNMKIPMSILLTTTAYKKSTSGVYLCAYSDEIAIAGSVSLSTMLKTLSATQKASASDIAQQIRPYIIGDNKTVSGSTWNSIVDPALADAGLSSMKDNVKRVLNVKRAKKPSGKIKNLYG